MNKLKSKTQLTRLELSEYLDQLLLVDHFKDFCPNGLQVQGKKHIQLIVSGVTASRALIEKAIRLHLIQSPRRIAAEFLRDAVLQVSGLMDKKLGGPPVRPYQPDGYYNHLNFPQQQSIF
jgi:hypothetical protein